MICRFDDSITRSYDFSPRFFVPAKKGVFHHVLRLLSLANFPFRASKVRLQLLDLGYRLPPEEARDRKKLLSNSPSEDGTSLLLSPDGADLAHDEVKDLWCEKVNIFFDGLRTSGEVIQTPIDPRMRTAANMKKNKAR